MGRNHMQARRAPGGRLLALCFALIVAGGPSADAKEAAARAPTAEGLGDLFPFGVPEVAASWQDLPGGTRRFEAVQHAVTWLATHQGSTGSWRPHELGWVNGKHDEQNAPSGPGKAYYEVGVTGLATAALLAAGVDPSGTHEHADAVKRALDFLVAAQDDEGCFGPRTTQQYIYNHAFALPAVLEAWALTGDPTYAKALQRGLSFSERARNPAAGWRYGVRPGDNDTSATCTSCMPFAFLHRLDVIAAAAGRTLPHGVPAELRGDIDRYLERVTDAETGRVGYLTRGTGPARPQEAIDKFPGELSEAMTAAMLATRLLLLDASPEDAGIRKSFGLVAGLPPRWDLEGGTIDLYYWYYGALAAAALPEASARTWEQALAGALIQAQRMDGSPAGVQGSWDAVGVWCLDGGRIYATAMACLSLLAPFRVGALQPERPDIVRALSRPIDDVTVERRLLDAVARLELLDALPALTERLGKGAPEVRLGAASALTELGQGNERVQATLRDLVRDGSALLRHEALLTLGAVPEPTTASLTLLEAVVADPDPQVRTAAARGLATRAADHAERLAALQQDVSPRVRAWAASPAAPHGNDEVLRACLATDDPVARAVALRALGRDPARTQPSAAAVESALTDPDLAVRRAAAVARLGLALPAEGPALEIVREALERARGDDLQLALEGARRAGPRGAVLARPLARLLGTPRHRGTALDLLERLGGEAVGAAPRLAVEARSKDRAWAARARALLALVAEARDRYVHTLLGALTSPDLAERESATALLTPFPVEGLGQARTMLRTGSASTRMAILGLVGSGGEPMKPLVPDVELLLATGDDVALRTAAARALGKLGPAAEGSVPALLAAAKEKDVTLHASAIQAIGTIDAEQAYDALLALAFAPEEPGANRQIPAIAALGHARSKADALVPRLLELYGTEGLPWGAREAIPDTLGRLGKGAVPRLRVALRARDPVRTAMICRALGAVGADAEDAVDDLIELLSDPMGFVFAGEAGSALAGIGKPAVKPLKKLLKAREAFIRKEVVVAFGRMGVEAKSVVSTLKRMARSDDDLGVRHAAERAVVLVERALDEAKGR
ncbi:MAG: HEAT repeat domain-containing protein [Planctomycetota bacterium]